MSRNQRQGLKSVMKILQGDSYVRQNETRKSPMLSVLRERTLYRLGRTYAEGARVEAWELHTERYKTQGTYREAQLKFIRPPRHGDLEEAASRPLFSVGSENIQLIVVLLSTLWSDLRSHPKKKRQFETRKLRVFL